MSKATPTHDIGKVAETPPARRVVLYGDQRRADVRHAIAQIRPFVEEKAEVIGVGDESSLKLESLDFDLLMNFGGDGSILGAVRAMGRGQRPIAGVNFGKIGFLASFELPDLLRHIDELLFGAPRESSKLTHTRTLVLEGILLRADGREERFVALNDAVIARGVKSRIIELSVSVGDAQLATYRCDGLIISTPAGSTAHALGAGGPVLHPFLEAFVIVSICPHSLAVRPLVVPSDKAIEIEFTSNGVQSGVTFDGQEFSELAEGDRLRVGAFSERAILVSPRKPTFYSRLRRKLHWGAGFAEIPVEGTTPTEV